MVDRTVYAADKTPDLPLRQVFGRQRVNEDLCKLAANSGLLTVGNLRHARRRYCLGQGDAQELGA